MICLWQSGLAITQMWEESQSSYWTEKCLETHGKENTGRAYISRSRCARLLCCFCSLMNAALSVGRGFDVAWLAAINNTKWPSTQHSVYVCVFKKVWIVCICTFFLYEPSSEINLTTMIDGLYKCMRECVQRTLRLVSNCSDTQQCCHNTAPTSQFIGREAGSSL